MPIHQCPSTAATAPRGRFDALVEINRLICREHYRLRLRVTGEFPPTLPGQFIQLGCRAPDGVDEGGPLLGADREWTPGQRCAVNQPELLAPLALLRRPFSLAGRGEDGDGTWLEIVHRVVGVGTDWLAHLQVGDAVDLIGPLGNSFTLPVDKSIGLLVGGGVGLPPMFYLAQAMRASGWRGVGFVGAMSRDLLAVTFDPAVAPNDGGTPIACVTEFARHDYPAVVTTNDGSLGLKGLITRGLEACLCAQSRDDAARTVVYTCGPEPMMHAVAKLAAAHGVLCQVCLEQAMACGMGTCQSCVVRIEDWQRPQAVTAPPESRPWRYRLACTDGPVFAAEQVVWSAGFVPGV
ncbi:MAG: hypothetical protein WD042_08315 [Phycisphaeraceae bacterium]